MYGYSFLEKVCIVKRMSRTHTGMAIDHVRLDVDLNIVYLPFHDAG
jgi:hypothetical protein